MSIIGTSSDAALVSPALSVIGNATGSESKMSVGVEARVDTLDISIDSAGAVLMVRVVYSVVPASDMGVSSLCDAGSDSGLAA